MVRANPDTVENEIRYAKNQSRSHDAVTSVYDDAGNVIETQEHTGEFKVLSAYRIKQKPLCYEARRLICSG